MRHIDHVVLAVRNLDEAGKFYQRLGFQVGKRNQHPWGTENRLVQFGRSFIELITVGQNANLIPPHAAREFSFGAFIRDYLRQREGLAMLVLSSSDAQKDAELFAERGIGEFNVFSFERSGSAPTGSEVRVAFSLAFARDSGAVDAGFFVCQQHLPEYFWDSRFQDHPNRARNISAVALTATVPEQHVGFFTAFTGAEPQPHPSGGHTFFLDGGHIEVLQDREANGARLRSPLLTSFSVQVDDVQEMAGLLAAAKVSFTDAGNALVISERAAFGVEIRLEGVSR